MRDGTISFKEVKPMRDIQEVVKRFRETGLKITPQRLSIFRLLQGNHSHPSAEDIYHEILKIHPSISFTTVYKTLQTLRDLGEIQELTINPERAHFDPVISEHAHTFCRSCKAIGDLDSFGDNTLLMDMPTGPCGFEVHNIQVHAVGLCGECR
jgi:Fur family peroxide stress response transcriptional regulator